MLIIAFFVKKFVNFKPVIYSYFLTFDATISKLVTDIQKIFDLPFAVLVSLFLLISAIFHFIIVLKQKQYLKDLDAKINKFRWYEYAISSSLMITLIAVLFGVYDIGALILIFGLNAVMNLFGLIMEKMNQNKEKIDWTPFIFGSIAGIIPWIVIIMYAFGNSNPAEIPWFVYAIFESSFVFFNLLPINMFL